MTLLSVTGQSQASPEDGWRTPAWTLTASGALSVVICAMVSPYRLSWVEALFYGALWVGLQFGIAMVAGRLASRYATPGRPNAPLNVRLALVAMWFAPVAALFVRHSPALVFAAVCMAFALASVERAGREEPHGRFFEAVALQSGVVALARGHVGVAALCLAVVAYRIARIEALQSRVWRSRVPVTVAVTLTVIGLLPISQRELAGASMDGPTPQEGLAEKGSEDMFSGVILKSRRPPHVIVVAPPAPRNSRGHGVRSPIVIPFSGEYRMYYWPLSGPPQSALQDFGDPTEFNFTAGGFTRLNMEARQALNTFLNADCCRAIEVDITSTDAKPETVALELLLRNTTDSNSKPQSAGLAKVSGTGKVSFDLPLRPALKDFDELIVVYRLHPSRNQRSANLSINSFSLIPRF